MLRSSVCSFSVTMTTKLHCYRCMRNSLKLPYSTEAVARITLPHKIMENFKKRRSKMSTDRYQGKPFHKGPLVISCKRKEFNHYKGQTYSDFSYSYLASGGWKHSRSVGDYFTINAFSSNPALRLSGEASLHTDFSTFGLHPDLIRGLTEHGIKQPTNIQALTIPTMMKGHNIMCCAETGSGKTLAYLLPILNRIKHYKALYNEQRTNTPYGLIVTPSRELSDQIYAVARDLAPYTDCQPHLVCGGRGTQKILNYRPQTETDLLVTTPGVLSKLLTTRLYSTERMLHVVLDEADTLMDDSFNALTLRLLQKLKITSEKLPLYDDEEAMTFGMQVAFVSATLPTSMEQILGDIVPMNTLERVTTSHIHSLMPHVTQKFYRTNGIRKPEEFLKLVSTKRTTPTIVFCRSSKTANFLGYLLEDRGINHVVMHANMPQKVRNGRFEQLLSGETNILISTDIASRGLDTTRVHQVINYEFPVYMSDYIHRAGRVGRVGSPGTGVVISFLQSKWEVDLLWKIEISARKITQLHNVNANIKRKIMGVRAAKSGPADLDLRLGGDSRGH